MTEQGCPGPSNFSVHRPKHNARNPMTLIIVAFNRKLSRIPCSRPQYSPTDSRLESTLPSGGGAAFGRVGITDVSSHSLRKTFATRLLSRGAAITDVRHILGHASVKTKEKAYAALATSEPFKQTIDLLDKPVPPKLTVVG